MFIKPQQLDGFLEDFWLNARGSVSDAVPVAIQTSLSFMAAPVTIPLALINGGLPAAGKQVETDVLNPGVKALGVVAPILPFVPYGYVGTLILLAAKLREQQMVQETNDREKAALQIQIDEIEAKIAAIKKTGNAAVGAQSAVQQAVIQRTEDRQPVTGAPKKIPWGSIATGAGAIALAIMVK